MKERYISLQEVAERLGVVRGTLHYYLERLEIERKRFPLDKRVYILESDYERIRSLKEEASQRSQSPDGSDKEPHLPAVDKEAA